MKMKTGLPAAILMSCLIVTQAFAAIDQTYVERILKENRAFIEFINTCASNFAPDKKDELLNIYQKHFNAEVAFLQGAYKRAFDNVYDSQKDMVELYQHILTAYYLEDSKNILDGLAPVIIRSKNALARQYLTLGYRDRTVARTHYIVGDASHPKLYSYKIFKYEEGIKMSRRAKRYGFLALYMGQNIEGKRKIFNSMFREENKAGSVFFSRFVNKTDEEYIKEMNVEYDEFEKRYENETAGSEQSKDSAIAGVSGKKPVFEKKIARRVRFRKERRLAAYLINGEFEKGEPIMRSYVDDYNFKLIAATLNTLSEKKEQHTGEASGEKGSYEKYMKDHKDNYSLLNGESLLKTLSGKVRVIDKVEKTDESEKIIEKGKSGEEKSDTGDKGDVKQENKGDGE